MGAIAVIVSDAAEPRTIERMLEAVPHRGPRPLVESLGSITMGVKGHDRDSWLSHDGEWLVAVVGSIDHLPWDQHNPAEALLEAARQSRIPEFARDTRGKFAFAAASANSLHLGRDHIGYLPLYVAAAGRRTVAATEVKQVLAGTDNGRSEPNLEYLKGLVFGADTDWRITAYEGAERLPRASIVTFERGRKKQVRRYWDPTPLLESRQGISLDDAAEGLSEVLETAITRVVTGDDAIALSGGIDSPTVAAYAAPRHAEFGASLLAVSAVFPDHRDVDESPYIQSVVDRYGLDWKTFRQVARPLDDLERWVQVLDGPGVVPSIPAIAEMYRLTAELGRSTLLTGELAEYVYNYEYQTLGYLLATGRWGAARSRVAEHRELGRSWPSLGREIGLSLAPSPLFRYINTRKAGRSRIPWLKADALLPPLASSDIPGPRERWRSMQIMPIASDYPLHGDDVEMCAASCGIDLRTPIADVDVWEFALSLPAEVKYPSVLKKTLVRRAMRGRVPDAILDRRDKTLFDSHGRALTDYEGLRRWILDSRHRLDGIDYAMLADRLERRQLSLVEEGTANTVARIHAFLEQW